MTKQEAWDAVNKNLAKFIDEEHIAKDFWLQTYEYNGCKFTINVFTYDKWLDEDPNNIEFLN